LLGGTANPWRDRLRAWGLLGTPYGAGARPSPGLRARIDSDRAKRIEAELARLAQHYQTTDAAATLARYQADYDQKTQQIAQAARAAELPPLVDTPPMTYDDELAYRIERVADIPVFRAAVGSMQSARVAIAFR